MGRRSRYDLQDVKARAKNHWTSILSGVASLDDVALSGRHVPCPVCGGTKPWRYSNIHDDGGGICNHCGKFGDGFAVIQWILGVELPSAIDMVGDFLGMEPKRRGGTAAATTARRRTPPAVKRDRPRKNKQVHFKELAWNDSLANSFCRRKGWDIDALKEFGAIRAEYGRAKEIVIAVPLFGESGATTGYTMFPVSGGRFRSFGNEGEAPKTLTYKFDGARE